jgi:hypothetical protein
VPPFPKPGFSYDDEVDVQLAALREYEQPRPGRAVLPKAADRVLLATWNLANLGVEQRRDKDDQLIAKLVGWFDLVALREVRRRRHRAPVSLQDQAGVPRLRPTTTSLTTGRCGRSSRPQP